MRGTLSGAQFTEGGCEYACEGKQTKRGFRVYCRKVEPKCKPGAFSPIPVTESQPLNSPSPITMSRTEYITEKQLWVIGRAMNKVKEHLANAQLTYDAIPKHHTNKRAQAKKEVQKCEKTLQKLENARIERTAEAIGEAINAYFNHDTHSTVSAQLSEPWLSYEHKKAVKDALQRGERIAPVAIKDYPEFD